MNGDNQHFAHDCHDCHALFHTTSHQAPVVRPKGGGFQVNAPQRSQVEDATHSAAAVLGQLGLPFPFAALFDLQIDSDVGDHLSDALEPSHIPQFCPQHCHCRR